MGHDAGAAAAPGTATRVSTNGAAAPMPIRIPLPTPLGHVRSLCSPRQEVIFPAMAGSLLITSGARAGERIAVDRTLVLGREGTDVVLEDTEVSRRHALIRVVDDAFELEDLGSRNGTRVDGERISGTVRLAERAQIRVGQTELLFEAPRQAGETVVAGCPRQLAASTSRDGVHRPWPPPPLPRPETWQRG